MHDVSKGMRKSIILGFPLVLLFINGKKYHLNLLSGLPLTTINIELKLVPLECF